MHDKILLDKLEAMLKKVPDIYDEHEFITGVLSYVEGDKGVSEMILYLEQHPDAGTDEVILKSLDISDKRSVKQTLKMRSERDAFKRKAKKNEINVRSN